MNIINKLTIRHMKKNKRRTLVTIIGVIISVAMLTAVATLAVSFLDLMKRQTIAMDGEWHVQYKNVNLNQLEAIAKDKNTDKLILSNDLGYSKLEGADKENKPFLFIKEYNQQGFKQFPIVLSKGRFPAAENEVLLPEHLAKDTGIQYKIGDQITLKIGNRYIEGSPDALGQNDPLQREEDGVSEELRLESTETFTVVGIMKRPSWEPMWSPGYTIISYIDKNLLDSSDTVNAVVTVKDVKISLLKSAHNLADDHNIEMVTFNKELLRYYGVTTNINLFFTFFSLTGIIVAVIIIGSVSLIYNAFAISVSERSRHLGMLSSVGATKKQKRNSVFFEGAVIGLISVPTGVISGIAGIGVTFLILNSFIKDALGTTEKLQVVITPLSILVSCIISIVTIFISTYIPARKASRISAIDAIRQTQDIKLSRKKVKTSKIVRKLFGLEAEIGLKNMKRNRKRYYATLFSLIISIILFLSVSFFTEIIERSAKISQAGVNYDIAVNGDIKELERLTDTDQVTSYSIQKRLQVTSLIEETKLPEELKDLINKDNIELENGKYQYYVNLYGMDNTSFQTYANKAGVDGDNYINTEEPTAIIIEHISYKDIESSKFIETVSLHTDPGEKLSLLYTNYATNKTVSLLDITIGSLTDEVPMGIYASGLGGIDVIVPLDIFNSVVDNTEAVNEVDANLYLNSTDPIKTQEILEKALPSSMSIYNIYQEQQREKQLILFMSVFTYGFIALISLISIANIFNTISTSITLRKREFAMLKSVGMTPKGFNKMIHYESIFYGLNSLIIGLPISFSIMYLLYLAMRETFEYGFTMPWLDIFFVIIAIFIIVSSAMLYSVSKIRKENIIEGLKQENI
ncbi:ABC transporter ATP-binding protein [Gracilibacillus boraciitolerans JCM 21714]|uniref:ABC transporter ATP-binding protein n=1 Tax=Gracilibacillus boraciitolerans JCM 21714 TaxID=1298598 RepID=W4VLF6_9BACI|nr:FtsX-like permease family protein [Gracilibacillus boraciitolerans]GAE93663.1 ABC transporter ATP-binding protein [Gracilibacillus boraciitolerans JCM 21714]